MAGHRPAKKKIPVRRTILVLAVVVLFGLIFLISGGGSAYHSSAKRAAEIQENTQMLIELSEKKPAAPDQKNVPSPNKDLDLSKEQDKVLKMDLSDYDDALTRRWFQNAVLLGDSITMAAEEYGYLEKGVILASIGASLETSEEEFQEAISRAPEVVFMLYGGNDISNYLGDPGRFISQYEAALKTLREGLPTSEFYLIGILPELEGVGYEEGYEFREQYNEALKDFCEEQDHVTYVDCDFLLDRDPSLYDADGIHPVGAFYPRWLTYLADISGLSGGADPAEEPQGTEEETSPETGDD